VVRGRDVIHRVIVLSLLVGVGTSISQPLTFATSGA
jgi:hypothetical protein